MSFDKFWLNRLLNPRPRRFKSDPRETWDPLTPARRTDTARRWL